MNEQFWDTFKTVAETGTFSQAARKLNLSQSAVSQQIQLLENEYQARLFFRTSHGVSLTPAGETVYRYVRTLLRTIGMSKAAVKQMSAESRPHLSIGASLTMAKYILPLVLKRVAVAHPNLRVTVLMANSHAVLDLLRVGEIDLALVESQIPITTFRVLPFMDDAPRVVVSRDHPWSRRQAVAVEEMLKEPAIIGEPGSGTRWVWEELLARHGYGVRDLNIQMVLATTQAIKAMVSSGMGYSVLSPLTLDRHDRESLCLVDVKGEKMDRHFSAVYADEATTPSTVSQFLKTLLTMNLNTAVRKSAG